MERSSLLYKLTKLKGKQAFKPNMPDFITVLLNIPIEKTLRLSREIFIQQHFFKSPLAFENIYH